MLEIHINDINKLCSLHKVKQLYAFGSVLTEKFNNDSDIDLLVDFEPIDVSLYVDNYYDFKFALQEILDKPIDLLEEKAIKNTVSDYIIWGIVVRHLQILNRNRNLIKRINAICI